MHSDSVNLISDIIINYYQYYPTFDLLYTVHVLVNIGFCR